MGSFIITINHDSKGNFKATYGKNDVEISNPKTVSEANRQAVRAKVDSTGNNLEFVQNAISSIGTRTTIKFRYPLQKPFSFTITKDEKIVRFMHPDFPKDEFNEDEHLLQLIGSEDFRDARAGWEVPPSFLIDKKYVAISVQESDSSDYRQLVIDTALVPSK